MIDDITNGRERTMNVLEVRRLRRPGRDRGSGPARARRPRVGHRAADARAGDPRRRRGRPLSRDRALEAPNVDLWLGTPADYARNPDNPEGKPWDLVIFEGGLPAELPDVPILAIAPDRSSPLGQVNGTLTNPGIGSLNPDEPILSFVDLSTLHVAEAARMTLPDWARAVIPGPRGAPLLYAGERDGLPTAVLAFDPRQSDLPLQVAFPILLANLTGELLGGSSTPVDPIRPGDPVELTIRPGTAALRITAPDGTVQELVAGTDGSSSVTYSATELPGVYTVTPILDPARHRRRPVPRHARPSAPELAIASALRPRPVTTARPPTRSSWRCSTSANPRSRRATGAAWWSSAPRRPASRASPGTAGGPAAAEPRADHARRAVDPDRAARPHRAVRRVGRLSPRRAGAHPARVAARLGRAPAGSA